MRWILKIVAYLLGGLLALLLLTYLIFQLKWRRDAAKTMALAGPEVPTLTIDGHTFRDLNKNGSLDVYEDTRAEQEDRINDLIGQMKPAEKAGILFAHFLPMQGNGEMYQVPSPGNPFTFFFEHTSKVILEKQIKYINCFGGPSALAMAKWSNRLQRLAERTRLGIPLTFISDPRHGTGGMPGASIESPWFSTWPSQLGLGATRDSALVREFADIVRKEYLSVGLRLAFHPMADLATDPRWVRANGTFGEDAHLSAKLTEAYVLGLQGDTLGPHSVATQVKHFSGGGPQEDGMDAHFASGKGQVYPGDNFDYHVIPFRGAFRAHAAQIMPYYGIPRGQTSEEVGFAYNKEIITDLLRDSLGFDGVVATDWGIVSDMAIKEASAWGVEHLSEKERIKKIIDAGCDVFGGDYNTELLVELMEEGQISEARINQSVRRVLRDKFTLGLFDDPFVAEDQVGKIARNPTFIVKGKEAQRRSLVLLKNENRFLPLADNTKLFLVGMDAEKVKDKFPFVVDNIEEADVIVQKLQTPTSPPENGGIMERFMMPQGRLDFPEDEKEEILERMKQKLTITVLTITRPPVVPEINAASKAVIADFECEDAIILEMIYGAFTPTGKLPIEIPSSVKAVEEQLEDVPYDSKDPLYPYGHGLSWPL